MVADASQISNLRLSSTNTQQFKDEISILRVENEDLRRKANAAENYRKKLVELKDVDAEVRVLRADLEKARAETRSAKEARVALEVDLKNCQKTLAAAEQECFEMQLLKRRVDADHKQMLARWETMNEDRLKDTEIMAQYQAQILDLESQVKDLQAEKNVQNGQGTLQDELQKEIDREE